MFLPRNGEWKVELLMRKMNFISLWTCIKASHFTSNMHTIIICLLNSFNKKNLKKKKKVSICGCPHKGYTRLGPSTVNHGWERTSWRPMSPYWWILLEGKSLYSVCTVGHEDSSPSNNHWSLQILSVGHLVFQSWVLASDKEAAVPQGYRRVSVTLNLCLSPPFLTGWAIGVGVNLFVIFYSVFLFFPTNCAWVHLHVSYPICLTASYVPDLWTLMSP